MLDERRTSLSPCRSYSCLSLVFIPTRDLSSHTPADSFAEAVQKLCPVDER
jgi:hypothetical protein